MALYQPTNITPNLMNGTAEGTVDATKDLTISWQINGPSAMTGFRIIIWSNVHTPLELYDSGVLRTGCPAYGRDNRGEIQMFSYTVSTRSIAFYSNPGSYRFSLYEYYIDETGATGEPPGTEVPIIRYPIMFQTAADSTFSTTGYSTSDPSTYTITTREKKFSFLNFSDGSPAWFRWVLYVNDGGINDPIAGDVIFDTGTIFGTGDMTFEYSGFINAVSYALRCYACDSYGREYESDLYAFVAEYDEITMKFPVVITPSTLRSATRVEWSGAFSIDGEASGDYSISNYTLALPKTTDSVTWSVVGANAMNYDTPWTVMYKGKVQRSDAVLWQLGANSSSNIVRLKYVFSTRTLTLEKGSTVLKT